MKKAVVLWTGGKDSAFALLESIGKYIIDRLVTFVPETQAKFSAHSLELIKAQAESIDLKHDCIIVKEPYNKSYREAIKEIKESGIDVLITGDISTVDGYPNWIRECANGIMDVYTPLWEVNRKELLNKIETNNFKIVCSLSYRKHFKADIAGRFLDKALVSELIQLENENKIDATGENGEYHTMVLDAPFFKYDLQIVKSEIEETNTYSYIKIGKIGKVVKEQVSKQNKRKVSSGD